MGETNDPPRRIEANFWLEDQAMDMAPIATAEAEIDDQGRFVIIAEKLELGPDVLGSESSVEARVELHGQSVDSLAWCGTVFGKQRCQPTDVESRRQHIWCASLHGGHRVDRCSV